MRTRLVAALLFLVGVAGGFLFLRSRSDIALATIARGKGSTVALDLGRGR